ncbi:Alpha-1,3/1,6-mannosyltransferase ALG2 [Nakaseomyces bracarensis]|uniref:Alpha-1,3/1,6-mannosyltransferase ALG2 n=1 Tax=Nakaseomyces bracarensis TaxID=273131 RepID=A0ABR4NM88_9SACH
MAKEPKLRVAFVHPDLGIGGAERLVVDAALGLQEEGHEVIIYTSHCDKTHCFEEVKNGTLEVEVMGDFFPTDFRKRFFIIFANLRQLYLIGKVILTGRNKEHDIFIVDQLSTCIPLLKLVNNHVLFYCHFPDQLLAKRTNVLKKMYRIPFDLLEQFTTYCSDEVVVNSNFTKSMYKKTFNYLNKEPGVIYPCVDTEPVPIPELDKGIGNALIGPGRKYYLSINRFEKKKNIELAIESYAQSLSKVDDQYKLLIVGGYDPRVHENVEYLKELTDISKKLKIEHSVLHYSDISKECDPKVISSTTSQAKIIFITSISSTLKDFLIQNMELLLYTPSFEHFGIVPLEAMKYGKPVLATNTGGPLETIESYIPNKNETSATGWLRSPNVDEWAQALLESKDVISKTRVSFDVNGPERVRAIFSRKAMTSQFTKNIILALQHGYSPVMSSLLVFLIAIIYAIF